MCVFFSLPGLTYNQAREKILNKHDIDIVETYTVPVEDVWNPFTPNRAYFFEGYNLRLEEISIIVDPENGEVFVVDK